MGIQTEHSGLTRIHDLIGLLFAAADKLFITVGARCRYPGLGQHLLFGLLFPVDLQSLSPIRATARQSAYRPASGISLLQRHFAPTRFGYFRLHTHQPQRPTVHPRQARAVKPLAVPHPLLAHVQFGVTRRERAPSVGTIGLAQRPVPGLRGISRPATEQALELVQPSNKVTHKLHSIVRARGHHTKASEVPGRAKSISSSDMPPSGLGISHRLPTVGLEAGSELKSQGKWPGVGGTFLWDFTYLCWNLTNLITSGLDFARRNYFLDRYCFAYRRQCSSECCYLSAHVI
jgi:hypothetical protein